ncbi:hypothetical protein DIE04_25395 [Burkholderia sp. Bp8994]|nr:hypothetical protein DIE20_24905 [Burkholderia sp. Bp9131]RQR68110.1 hypothetical protein DIE12_27040 [Burkholderia sp. Bp9015]RQR84156.1 hypothetical protein DIE10_12410 [Burkholderia sp. Bp9011]RQR91607.1 hypothetical protein DIE04_25395 [Burkholderia sp. Bp8994]RQR94362.1 hypothetical protein DIE09_12600 [Burkholderia sp. Bp9010]RQS11838.1 hypothetical protein DIE02_08385 [Burkholderia sp. Bp8991]RQS23823.1 hypothetical protein DIE05_27335 [Burkholderia sp. Bp8995]RQS42370.1 hypothetic
MTGHYEDSFHRLAAIAYAGVRSSGAGSGRPPDSSGPVRPARYTRAYRAAVGRRTATAVAAPVRRDDSRQEQVP